MFWLRSYQDWWWKISLDGNQKHKTKHNEYICYECGAIMDRDENAVANLLALLN